MSGITEILWSAGEPEGPSRGVPWAHAPGVRVALLLLVACGGLSGCTGSEETDALIAVVVGSVVGVLLAVCCGGGWFMGCLVAGGINMRLNTTKPTTKSRGWGFAWGVFNGINGLIGGALVIVLAIADSDAGEPADVEAIIYLSLASVLALVVSVVTLVLAAKAEPGRVYEL